MKPSGKRRRLAPTVPHSQEPVLRSSPLRSLDPSPNASDKRCSTPLAPTVFMAARRISRWKIRESKFDDPFDSQIGLAQGHGERSRTMKLVVMKFGGSSVANAEKMKQV